MSIEDFIFKSEAKDFDPIKTSILSSISDAGKYSIVDNTQSIRNTDWHLSDQARNRGYWHCAEPLVVSHINGLVENFSLTNAQVANYWFQQYETGDYHTWHNHSGCCFSSVLYVELGDSSPSTTFRWMGRSFEVPVKEGDTISFPSFVAHGSKVNKSTRKTVISYNTRVTITE